MANNFVFYESWIEAINALPTREQQNEAIRKIVMYGTSKEEALDDDILIEVIFKAIKPQIDAAKRKYEHKKESKSEVNDLKIKELADGGMRAKVDI